MLTPELDANFMSLWREKPEREGGNPIKRAYRAYRQRRKYHSMCDIFAGLMRYKNFCHQKRQIGTPYVMQLATFLGPDEHFLEDWSVMMPRATRDISVRDGLSDRSWAAGPRSTRALET